MITDLPYTLTVDGIEREIYCDFRDVIQILAAYADEQLTEQDKSLILLNNLYVEDYTTFTDIEAALKKAIWFVDQGVEYKREEKAAPQILSWEQDYELIISAVNQKIHKEVRETNFLHWWTFLSYFSERGECRYSTVLSIRDKLAKGQKLEKHEKEILRENKDIIMLKSKSDDEFENDLWGD